MEKQCGVNNEGIAIEQQIYKRKLSFSPIREDTGNRGKREEA